MKLRVGGDVQVKFDVDGTILIVDTPNRNDSKRGNGYCPGCSDSMGKDPHTCTLEEPSMYDEYRRQVVEVLPYFYRMTPWEQSFIIGVAQYINSDRVTTRQEISLNRMYKKYTEQE